MLGNLLSTVTKIVTLPIDVAEVGLDVVTGGDGSRRELKSIAPMPSDARDAVCEILEDLD